MGHPRRLLVTLLGFLLVGCGSGADAIFEVRSEMLSHRSTLPIWMWAPEAEGSWPVVYALPGASGDARKDLETLGTELASHGVVVFGTYVATSQGVAGLKQSSECGYRYVREVAADHGGDLTQPVTMIGFSAGATGALYHGLDADYGPGGTYDECFDGAPRPDVVVAMAGCHSRFGFPALLGEWGNPDIDIVLVSGADDEECPSRQSDYAEERLSDKGYSVLRIDIPDANHAEFIFRDADSNWQTVPVDHPTSQKVVTIILDAIEAAQQKG